MRIQPIKRKHEQDNHTAAGRLCTLRILSLPTVLLAAVAIKRANARRLPYSIIVSILRSRPRAASSFCVSAESGCRMPTKGVTFIKALCGSICCRNCRNCRKVTFEQFLQLLQVRKRED
jgi:hypothetical protein